MTTYAERARRSQLAVNRAEAIGIIKQAMITNQMMEVSKLAALIEQELRDAGLLATGETWYRGVDEDGENISDEIAIWDESGMIHAEAEGMGIKGTLQRAHMCKWVDVETFNYRYSDEEE